MRGRDATRLVNAARVANTSSLGTQAHAIETVMRIGVDSVYVVRRKNITIREDQAEWVEENHLNLSSFVRGQLDDLIEERS